MSMGNSKNSHVFNFAILLKLRKFDACEIYMFYSTYLVKESISNFYSGLSSCWQLPLLRLLRVSAYNKIYNSCEGQI